MFSFEDWSVVGAKKVQSGENQPNWLVFEDITDQISSIIWLGIFKICYCKTRLNQETIVD